MAGRRRHPGITAGASAPEALVRELVQRIAEIRPIQVELLDGIAENVHFKLPAELESTEAA